jgi:hypothetical protein
MEQRRLWQCENCGKTLGDFLGARLVIERASIRATFPLVTGAVFTCHRCGHPNQLNPSSRSPKSEACYTNASPGPPGQERA